MPLGLNRALRALNLSERAGKSAPLARAYAGMSLVTGMLRLHALAERYAVLAEKTARDVGNLPTLAFVLMVSGVYRLGTARWQQVLRDAEESIALAEQLGDLHQLGHSLTVRAMLHCFRANYAEALQDYEQLREIARRHENVVLRAWSFSGRGECLFRQSRLDEAIACFTETLQLLSGLEHRTEDIRMHGMLAAAHLALGNEDQAWSFAQQTMQIISQGSYATVSTLEGFDGATEVCLVRLEAEPENMERRQAAERACGQLRWYAGVYPIGRPRWLHQRGRLQGILGKETAAHRDWRRALREAKKYGLPFEQRVVKSTLDRYI